MIVKMMFVSYFLFINTPGKLEIYNADTSRLREDVAWHWGVKASFARNCTRTSSFQHEILRLIVRVLIAYL